MSGDTKEIKQEQEISAEEQNANNDAELKKAMEDYKKDMFKFKEQSKAMEAENLQLKADQEKRERASLEKNEEWKSLYELEKQSKDQALEELQDKSTKFIDSAKINAVLAEVGGFKKDCYAKFIDAKNVEMTENGTIDSDSLKRESDRIRQEYSELLNVNESPKLPNNAPSNLDPNSGAKTLGQLNKQQLKDAFSASKKN